MAAQNERKFPGEIVPVMEPGVESLAPEWTREMSGVANQEPPALRQARDDPPMHPKRSEPTDVGGTTAPAKSDFSPGGQILGSYRLYLFLQVLKTDPSSARER